MENIVQSNNRDLRLAAVKVGVLSTLRLSLPDVPANATRVEVIVTNGDTHTAYGAHIDSSTERWLVDVAAAQFPACGKQKYEIAYRLDGKQFWDGSGWVTVEDATTGGITPSPAPDPARYVVTRINGYGAPNPDGEVRIPRLSVATEDPTSAEGYIEYDQLFNRVTGSLFVLCSVGGTLTWVQTAGGGGAVASVNGKTPDAHGDVELTADDVLTDEQMSAVDSGITTDLVPKVLTVDETTAMKRIMLDGVAFTSFSELTALVQKGVTRLRYYVTNAASWPVLYVAHLCDDSAIRFDATGTLGETVYTRSIAVTKTGEDGIAVSVGALTEMAKKADVPAVTETFTEADAGQAADAAKVGEALAGKLSNGGLNKLKSTVIINCNTEDIQLYGGGSIRVQDEFGDENHGTVLSAGGISFYDDDGNLATLGFSGDIVVPFDKVGTLALLSDIADATKLTPVKDGEVIVGYTTAKGETLMAGSADAKAALFAGAVISSTSTELANMACSVVPFADGMTITFAASTGLRQCEVLITGCTARAALNVTATKLRGDADALTLEAGDNHLTFAEYATGEFFVTRHLANEIA